MIFIKFNQKRYVSLCFEQFHENPLKNVGDMEPTRNTGLNLDQCYLDLEPK